MRRSRPPEGSRRGFSHGRDNTQYYKPEAFPPAWFFNGRLRILFWNSSALLGRYTNYRAKVGAIRPHILNADVSMFQEVHGSKPEIDSFAQKFSETHLYFSSPGPNHATGGVLTLISKRSVTKRTIIRTDTIVPGRILAVTLSLEGKQITFINVHNERLKDYQSCIQDRIRPLVANSVADPCNCSIVVAGDVNFDRGRVVHAGAHPPPDDLVRRQDRPLQLFWEQLLNPLMELVQDDFTRMGGTSSSNIDRCWMSFPSWALPLTNITFKTLWNPIGRERLSDHSPMSLCLSSASSSRAKARLVPQWITRDRQYKVFLQDALDDAQLDSLGPLERWETHKRILLSKSQEFLIQKLRSSPDDPHVKLQLLMQASRALWYNNIGLFSKVCRDWPEIRSMFKLAKSYFQSGLSSDLFCYKVVLYDSHRFHKLYSEAKTSHIQRELDDMHSSPLRGRHRRAAKLSSWLASWSSMGRRVQLGGVKVMNVANEEEIICDAEGMNRRLAGEWSKVFEAKPVDSRRRDVFLRRFQIDLSDMPPPSLNSIMAVFKRYANKMAAPGPDGLSYSHWGCTLFTSSITLLHLLQFLCDSGCPPAGFNESLMLFIPKAVLSDEHFIVRKPSQTRPISLKNTDNKLIAATVNLTFTRLLTERAHISQQGFLPGRHFEGNIVVADAVARAISISRPSLSACMISHDLGTAFPSLSHEYMEAAIVGAAAPSGFHDLVKSLYTECLVFLMNVPTECVFKILSGVLQGCPLSASLFILALQPFLALLCSRLQPDELARACADDVLTVTSCADSLKWVSMCFEYLGKVSGMWLKFAKVHIVPLARTPSPEFLVEFTEFLHSFVPHFREAQTGFHLKYLGVLLGPRSKPEKWIDQMSKFENRFHELCDVQRAGSLLIPIYNSRILPVLGYLAQMEPIDKDFSKREIHILHRVCKFLPSSFPLKAFAHFGRIGLPVVHMMRPTFLATMMRFARVTIPAALNQAVSVLDKALADHGSMYDTFRNQWPRGHWDTVPFASSLLSARNGFDDQALFSKISSVSVGPAYQSRLYTVVSSHLYADFSWPEFLHRRCCMTYPCVKGHLCIDLFTTFCKRLKQLRPVLVSCVLRWFLNAIPMASRMHDDSFDACPFCGSPHVKLNHLLSCERPFRLLVKPCLYLSWHVDGPVSYSNFVARRLGLSLTKHELYVQAVNLFCVQHAFLSLRRSAVQLPSSPDDDLHIQNLYRAARLQLHL